MLVIPAPSSPVGAHRAPVAALNANQGPNPMTEDVWSPGTSAPIGVASFEDLLVLVFSVLLEREAHGIAEDVAALNAAAQDYASSGDLSPIQEQRLTDMRLELRARIKDREHLFSIVLGILDSLHRTANMALESMGK